jgi:uncharacterized membrane protein HdeD (DUF308 family)
MLSDWLTAGWKILLLRGLVALLFGIVAMVWPVTTVVALVVLWGIWALVDGIGAFGNAFSSGRSGWARVGFGLLGVIAVLAALYAFFRPGATAVVLTWVLGIWLLARGISELVIALTKSPPAPRWLMLLGAALDVVLGILFVANPGRGAVGIAVVLGIFAVAWGVVFILLAFAARKLAKEVQGMEASAG